MIDKDTRKAHGAAVGLRTNDQPSHAMLFVMRVRRKLILLALVLFAAILFFTGINWGLPSRESDVYLFAGRTPWTGQRIMQLAGAWDTDTTRGADIAMHPLTGRDKPVVLNDTDAKRAEIVRRYRLYSNQPDEMITFRSLSRMKPGKLDFDPTLYQYGGLWIYPIGAMLKAASLFHLVTLRTDLAFYLDHPTEFSRFYLVARTYSALWGILGVLVVFALGYELSGKFLVGAGAAGVYATMPVVIDLAHEAKPHLAGTVLILMTVLAGVRYVRTGAKKWWILAGVFAGASMGMVLTGYVAFAVLPMMVLLCALSWKQKIRIVIFSLLTGLAVFILTNPYLPYNLLFHREVLHSNVGNYGTFYRPEISVANLQVAWGSLIAGMSLVPLLLGLIGSILFLAKRKVGLLPVAVAAVVLFQPVLLAGGKTTEYARFALTLDVILAIAAAWVIGSISISSRERCLAVALLVATTLFFGLRYEINFIADNQANSTRNQAAQTLEYARGRSRTLAVWAEPAPYCLPPVDLFDWQIILEPRGVDSFSLEPGIVGVLAVDYSKSTDRLAPSPISWANKPFQIVNAASVSMPENQP